MSRRPLEPHELLALDYGSSRPKREWDPLTAIVAVMTDRSLRGTDKLILVALAVECHTNQRDCCACSYEILAERAGVSRGTAIASIRRLVRHAGPVILEARGCRGSRYVYQLRLRPEETVSAHPVNAA